MRRRQGGAVPATGLLVTTWLVLRQLLMTAFNQPERGPTTTERQQRERKQRALASSTPPTPKQTFLTLLREFFYALILQPSGSGDASAASKRRPRK